MEKLLARFGGESSNGDHKLWLIGTGKRETYLRSQVDHITMENDWDLQALSIASDPLCQGCFRASVEELGYYSKNNLLLEMLVAKLVAVMKSFFEAKPEAAQLSLPQWLQNAKLESRDAIASNDRKVFCSTMVSSLKDFTATLHLLSNAFCYNFIKQECCGLIKMINSLVVDYSITESGETILLTVSFDASGFNSRKS